MGDAEIQLDPPMVELPASGGTSEHNIVNPTEARLAFKCKCSDNNLYRFTPVFGIVEPGQVAPVSIKRMAGPAKEDKLAIEVAEISPEETNPQEAFPAGGAFPKATFPLVGV